MVTAPAIIDAACRACGVTFSDLCSKSRMPAIVRARRLAAYLLRTHWPLGSYPSIAKALGKRDTAHATVQEQYHAACRLIETDPHFAAAVRVAEARLSTVGQTT